VSSSRFRDWLLVHLPLLHLDATIAALVSRMH
jgi:hypothetical protein